MRSSVDTETACLSKFSQYDEEGDAVRAVPAEMDAVVPWTQLVGLNA